MECRQVFLLNILQHIKIKFEQQTSQQKLYKYFISFWILTADGIGRMSINLIKYWFSDRFVCVCVSEREYLLTDAQNKLKAIFFGHGYG